MEKATPHIDFWIVKYMLNEHVEVFKTRDPHILPVEFLRDMKASFVCEHDLFQVFFIILYATLHFQGKHLVFGSGIWFEFLQNLNQSAIYKACL